MIRTQVQLEERVWQKLRGRAFAERRSIADLMREAIRKDLGLAKPKRKWRLEDFTFVGAGRSRGPGAGTIAERHDEELAKAIKND